MGCTSIFLLLVARSADARGLMMATIFCCFVVVCRDGLRGENFVRTALISVCLSGILIYSMSVLCQGKFSPLAFLHNFL